MRTTMSTVRITAFYIMFKVIRHFCQPRSVSFGVRLSEYNVFLFRVSISGGLGFTSGEIGTTLLIAGVLMMIPQIVLFQRVRVCYFIKLKKLIDYTVVVTSKTFLVCSFLSIQNCKVWFTFLV